MRIKFDSGSIERVCAQYFNLVLMQGNKVVYKATITQALACNLIEKKKTIKLIQNNA